MQERSCAVHSRRVSQSTCSKGAIHSSRGVAPHRGRPARAATAKSGGRAATAAVGPGRGARRRLPTAGAVSTGRGGPGCPWRTWATPGCPKTASSCPLLRYAAAAHAMAAHHAPAAPVPAACANQVIISHQVSSIISPSEITQHISNWSKVWLLQAPSSARLDTSLRPGLSKNLLECWDGY